MLTSKVVCETFIFAKPKTPSASMKNTNNTKGKSKPFPPALSETTEHNITNNGIAKITANTTFKSSLFMILVFKIYTNQIITELTFSQ